MRLDLPDEDVLLVLLALRRAGTGRRVIGQAQRFACADLADRVRGMIELEAGERAAPSPPQPAIDWEKYRRYAIPLTVAPADDPGRCRSWLVKFVGG